jgi:heme oxygenase
MSAIETAAPVGTLTEALRERTKALHTAAERTGIVNDFLKRKADRQGYSTFLFNMLPAYGELESALERRRNQPLFYAFARRELYRIDSLSADLAELSGANWRRELVLLPAAERYSARIAEVADGDAGRLIAHAYVRYFGDLSGGQILKGLLGKTLNLPPQALSFYDFPGIADHTAFKNAMRHTINVELAAVCDPEAVIDEAKLAFEHNIAISKAVQETLLLKI